MRTIDFQINDVKQNCDEDIQPFFASSINDAQNIINYSDDQVLNFVLHNTDGQALLKTLTQKENDIQAIYMRTRDLSAHYNSKTAKAFRAELIVVKEEFRDAEQYLKDLEYYFYDSEETESLRKSVAEQNKRLEKVNCRVPKRHFWCF